jgi:hypothetical protein
VSPVNVRIPDELRDRIDRHRPATVSREAWVREALEAALGGSSGHEAGAEKRAPASPRARGRKDEPVDLMVALKASLDTAAGGETPVSRPLTQRELAAERQRKLNTNKKGSAT